MDKFNNDLMQISLAKIKIILTTYLSVHLLAMPCKSSAWLSFVVSCSLQCSLVETDEVATVMYAFFLKDSH